MAFTPGYTHDIFISYAHIDNLAFPGQADGWIKQFFDNLNLMLAKRFGRLGIVNFWWDSKKLDGSVLFDASIEEGIKKSAIMICLNSPGYMASKYCLLELDTFYKKTQAEKVGLNIGNRSRILNVLLNNIPFNQWPQELSGTSGFPFHDAKESDDFGDTIDTLAPGFRTQMQNIRDAVWNLLNDFKDLSTQDISAPAKPVIKEDNKFSIYLGEVPDTLRTPRKRIITELEKKGFTIITGVPPPDDADAHEAATNSALQKADISIHLLDEFSGREIVGDPTMCYPQKQVEIAFNTGKSQMIWIPAETDIETIEEEPYKQFLKGLETGKAPGKGYEFVRGSKSTLAQEIADFATMVQTRQKQKQVEQGKVSVLLDTHYMDQLYALELSKSLLEHHVQPFINPQEDDPRKNINLMGDRLSQVKKLIFLYGGVSKEWVRERMSAAIQLIITNNYPIEDFFIYMAPPYKEDAGFSLNQRFLKVNVVNGSDDDGLDQVDFDTFLQAIKAGAA